MWMFTTAWSGHWTPLTWLTLGLDWTIWGLDPFGYHLTSLIFHIANAVVFFVLARHLLGRALPGATPAALLAGATAAALVFAVHPLRAESVVWVSERRDVVSGLFYLLTVVTYLQANEGDPRRRRRWLAVSVVIFILAVLSKAIVVSLPVLLLVLDVYPLRRLATPWRAGTASRIGPVLAEKLPYVAVAVAGGLIAISRATEFNAAGQYPLWVRPAVFGYNLVLYLWNTAVPYALSPLYEMPVAWELRDSRLLLGCIVPVVVTVALLALRRRWPAGLAVWTVYVATVAPVGGLVVHTGPQMAADRYTYLACLGFALLVGGAVALALRPDVLDQQVRRFAIAGTLLVLVGLGVLGWQQSRIWRDSISLWGHAVTVDPGCARCLNGLGAAQHAAGASAAAVGSLRQAVVLRPDIADFHADLGIVLLWLDQPGEAAPHLERAIQTYPDHPDLNAHLGVALIRTNRAEDGRRRLETVLKRRPDHVEALTAMGFALTDSGRPNEAAAYFERAVARAPRAPGAHYGLARLYLARGDQTRAEPELDWLRKFAPALAERAQRR